LSPKILDLILPSKTAHEQYNSSDSAPKRKSGYEQAPASVGSTHTDDLDAQSMTVRKLILSDQRNKGGQEFT
jgi:hypothetical protein